MNYLGVRDLEETVLLSGTTLVAGRQWSLLPG
jgi:hypothetical protein